MLDALLIDFKKSTILRRGLLEIVGGIYCYSEIEVLEELLKKWKCMIFKVWSRDRVYIFTWECECRENF